MTRHGTRRDERRRGLHRVAFASIYVAAAFVCASSALVCASAAFGQSTSDAPPAVRIDADGAVHVPAHVVPISSLLSPEGKAYMTEHLLNMQRPEMLVQENGVRIGTLNGALRAGPCGACCSGA